MDRLLIQSVVDYAIYMLTPEGIVANWNPGAERAKGYTAAEIVGTHYSAFYSNGERATGVPDKNLSIARETGRFEAEGWRIRKDGTSFWAHVVIDAVRSAQGDLLGFAKITRDCTAERLSQIAQREHEQRFRLLVQGITDYAIYMLDREGHVVNWNAGAERAKGYQSHEIIGKHFSIFYTPEDREEGLPAYGLETALREGRFEAEGMRERKDGSRFWTNVVIDVIHDDNGEFIGFAKITRDITERRRVEVELKEAKQLAEKYSQEMAALSQFLHSVIENIPTSIFVQDIDTKKVLLANRQAETIFGTSVDEMIGKTPAECLSKPITEYLARQQLSEFKAESIPVEESEVQTFSGIRTLRSRLLAGCNPSSQVDYALYITEDVTEERAARERMHHMAHHDALTGLPNRIFFNKCLHDALVLSDSENAITAVVSIDLDNFKDINDVLGHSVGDKLLSALSARLRDVLPREQVIARLGGDEFAIVAARLDKPAVADEIAQTVIDAFVAPFVIDTHSVSLGGSLGIALAPDHHNSAEQLLQYADMALYDAKRKGGNQFARFRHELNDAAILRHNTENELRAALQTNQIQLVYQPIISAQNNVISGYEALLRWVHPIKGLIMPLDFIPIAEETGIIHALGLEVLKIACEEAATWDTDQSIAVNLSPIQFEDPFLANKVQSIVEASGLDFRRLAFEVTESVLLENTAENIRTLHALKALGISIALDDFGTGYSSLAYLRTFQFDRIKIDRSFVQDIESDREAEAIVRAIVSITRSLGIEVTAEGVETEGQYVRLHGEGCSHFQGYFFGRPASAQMRNRNQLF